MAKLVLDDIGSTLTNTAATTINNNNDKIETALENTLSRDGSTPNNMQADIDMDSNDLLNVNQAHVEALFINGSLLVPSDATSIPPSSITTGLLADGAVTNDKLGDGAVSTVKLADGSVTNAKVRTPSSASDPLAVQISKTVFAQSDTGAVSRLVSDKLGQYVDAADFGAVSYTKAQIEAANGVGLVDASPAIQAAMNAMFARGGGFVFIQKQFYVCLSRLEIPAGVRLIGAGVGEWEPIFTSRPKTWTGTNLLFKGTGTADLTMDGITSMEHGGGWRENPSSPGTYFKKFTAYNSDATGTTAATKKGFSAAILVKENTNYAGLHGVRIVNWIGTDGITDWSNTGSTSLGDDWDFGLLLRNAEYFDGYDIQGVGGWREAAHAQVATVITDSRSERNRIVRAKFQGKIGTLIAAADRWAVTATTATTVTIRWSNQLYFAPGGGTFRGSDNVTYTYTGVTHAGSDANYIFTGVTPDPNAAGIFHIRHPGAGFGNSSYQDVYSYGLNHQSGNLASFFSLTDSKALEISGFPLRGVKFHNFKCHTNEPVVFHLHDAQDITFIDPQFEGGGHVIASPQNSLPAEPPNWVPAVAQVGETRGLLISASAGISDQNRALFYPRNGLIEELQISPRSDLTGDLQIKPLRAGKKVTIFEGDGTTEYLRGAVQTWTPSIRFVTVTHTSQVGQFHRVGDCIFFSIKISYTGLDTADTSALDISLPSNPDTTKALVAEFNERLSTGLNFSTLTRPFADVTTGPGLGVSHNRTTRVAYNTAGVMSAAGDIVVTGHYWEA